MLKKTSHTCLWALLATSGMVALADDGPTAKALFFSTTGDVLVAQGPTAPPTTTKAAPAVKSKAAASKLGVSYFVRLQAKDGSSKNVLTSRQFKSGERFQLGLKVAGPTYVYVLNEDNAGHSIVLYPQPGQDPFINAMGTVFLPGKGSFEFDAEPGIEQLTVLLSKSKLEQPIAYLQGGKPDYVSDASSQAAPVLASKGVVFNDDPTPTDGNRVASYVVKPMTAAGDVLNLKIKLVHK